MIKRDHTEISKHKQDVRDQEGVYIHSLVQMNTIISEQEETERQKEGSSFGQECTIVKIRTECRGIQKSLGQPERIKEKVNGVQYGVLTYFPAYRGSRGRRK
jgi:hypothetical protein